MLRVSLLSVLGLSRTIVWNNTFVGHAGCCFNVWASRVSRTSRTHRRKRRHGDRCSKLASNNIFWGRFTEISHGSTFTTKA